MQPSKELLQPKTGGLTKRKASLEDLRDLALCACENVVLDDRVLALPAGFPKWLVGYDRENGAHDAQGRMPPRTSL